MKVSILAPDASVHTLPRTRLLAHALARQHDCQVQTIAPIFDHDDGYGKAAWPGSYDPVDARPRQGFRDMAREIASRVTGDVIYAMKPRPASLGVALWAKKKLRVPLVLDVDDWELYMVPPYSRFIAKNLLYSLPRLHRPEACYLYYLLLETMARPGRAGHQQVDGVTSVSRFFVARYGGVYLPQGCDTSLFSPERFDRQERRRAWGLEGILAVVFAGSPQPHKGLDLVVTAVRQLARPDVQLVVAGADTPFCRTIAADPYVRYVGMLSHEQVPEFLSLATLVALPQRDSPFARGQVPLKLFEAMSMGCPIVATAVSDLPEILDGCGLVVPYGEPDALAAALAQVLDNPSYARQLGDRARKKCLRDHSLLRIGSLAKGALQAAIERGSESA